MVKQETHAHQPLVNNPDDSDDEGSETYLPQSEAQSRDGSWRVNRFRYHVSNPIVLALIILATVFVTLCGSHFLLPMRSSTLDRSCASHTTHWSPLLADVAVKYRPKLFDGAFMKENIYRKVGSDKVDKAWEDMGVDYRAGVISYEDGIASGLDASFVQRADKYGGGFLVNVEGMHHLHCLNLVRKSLYFNVERYRKLGDHAFKNKEPIVKLHVTHCLDAIRQVLQCNVDTGVLGQVWVHPDEPSAFPDFRTKHVCKNYDDIRKWAEKLQAPDDVPEDYLQPPRDGDVLEDTP